MLGQRDDAVVVGAALDDGVHLHAQAGGRGRVDSVEHALHGKVDVVERAKRCVVDGVEAHRDAVESRLCERLGLLREQRAVRRECDLEAGNLAQQLDEVLDVPPHERLAAGDPHDAHAEAGEDGGDASDLLEAQELFALEEDMVAAVDLLRHAVDAAEVAAIRDRDPERLERAVQLVEERLHRAKGSLRPGRDLVARLYAPPRSWRAR